MKIGQPDVVDDQSEFTIWGKTLTAGRHVYLLQNICHFGAGTISQTVVPWIVVLAGCGVGFLFSMVGILERGLLYLGMIILVGMFALLVVNLANRQRQGLVISMTSGEKIFFPTQDKNGIARVSMLIRQVFDEVAQENSPKTVTVNHGAITIMSGASISGNVNSGSVGSSMGANIVGGGIDE